jgi:predicted DNA-binding protein
MTSQVRRITVSLPPEQVRGLKNISKMLKRPVSGLVSEMIGEVVLQFEQVVISKDISSARERVESMYAEALDSIREVENAQRK